VIPGELTYFGLELSRGSPDISYTFGGTANEVFGEIMPVLDLTPDVELNLNLVAGLRFYID